MLARTPGNQASVREWQDTMAPTEKWQRHRTIGTSASAPFDLALPPINPGTHTLTD
jgi:hypothetical protein